jgi:N-acetylmuramoyl-L-alanine amidase
LLRPANHRAVRFCLAAAILLAGVLLLSGAPDTKRLSVYSSTANYSLPVIDRNGGEYIGLLEILGPLGAVTTRVDGRTWRVHYNNLDAEFTDGKTRARIQGQNLDLPGNFSVENGRGLIPLSALPILLQHFLSAPVNFRESSRRLFIGDVGVHFTAQVNKTTPPTLVMNFTSPVNPMIATEPGKLRMVFTHEPIVPPGSQSLTFDSPIIPSASFQENNGAAEISVAGPVPLFASFSNDGRTITITPAPQAVTRSASIPAQTLPVPVPNTAAAAQPASSAQGAPAQTPPQYFAVVDASHGGDERGAALSDQLAEKDVTLAFARRLQQELQARGFNTLLLRDGDVSLPLDQRASMTNGTHPAIYICLHAGSQGSGVRLFTALLPAGGDSRGPFLDWDTAQTRFRAVSQTAESGLASEFGKRQVPVRSFAAPLRPLNNVAAAAVAIEVAPPAGKISELSSPAYQQLVAEAIVAGIETVKERLEAGQELAPTDAAKPQATRTDTSKAGATK